MEGEDIYRAVRGTGRGFPVLDRQGNSTLTAIAEPRTSASSQVPVRGGRTGSAHVSQKAAFCFTQGRGNEWSVAVKYSCWATAAVLTAAGAEFVRQTNLFCEF